MFGGWIGRRPLCHECLLTWEITAVGSPTLPTATMLFACGTRPTLSREEKRSRCRHGRGERCVILPGQPLQLLLHGVRQGNTPHCVLEVGSVTRLAGIEDLRCVPGAGGRFDLRQ